LKEKETLDPSFFETKTKKKARNKLEKDTPFQIIEDFLHVRGLAFFSYYTSFFSHGFSITEILRVFFLGV